MRNLTNYSLLILKCVSLVENFPTTHINRNSTLQDDKVRTKLQRRGCGHRAARGARSNAAATFTATSI